VASFSYCGNFPVLSDSAVPKTTPIITNITIAVGDIGNELSHALPNGTKKILIKHRNNGNIDFSFITGLINYVQIPKGTSYCENNLNTENETIYYRTNKIGIIEILTWS